MEKHTGNYGEEQVETFPSREGKSPASERKDKEKSAPLTADYNTPLTDTHAGQSKKDGAAQSKKDGAVRNKKDTAAKDCKGDKSCR